MNYLAWRIFWKIIQFSTYSEHIPTMSAAQFIIDSENFVLTTDEYSSLINRIGIIYSMYKEHWIIEYNESIKRQSR